MKINTDITMALDMMALLESKKYQVKEEFDVFMETMSKSTGFVKMIQFYEAMYSYEAYKEILFLALNDLAFTSESDLLNMLYQNLKRMNVALLTKKVERIQTFDFESILHRLESTLPDDTEIALNLYFVVDGINAASVSGEDTILLNTMFWPSEKENENLMIDVLLHEYHHIGLKCWLSKQNISSEDKYLDPKSFVKYMTASIIGEGAATYFFTQSDHIYPLILESHGEEIASNFRAATQKRSEDIDDLLEKLNRDLIDVLTEAKQKEALAQLSSDYSFDPSGNEPRDKTIGQYMCRRIDETLGRKQLIQCFKQLSSFYEIYNLTIKHEGDFTFSSELIGL